MPWPMLLALTVLADLPLRPDMPAIPPGAAPPLWQAVPDADLQPAGLALAPARACQWVVAPGEPFELTVKVEAGEGDRALLTVWDAANHPVAQQGFAAPASEGVTLRVAGRGGWLLTLDRLAGDRPLARLARSFAVCPDNRPMRAAWQADEFLLGTCSFPGRQHWSNAYGPANPPGLSEQEARDLDAELVARLGLQAVRLDLPWVWPAPEAGIDWSRADPSVRAFTSRGLKLDLQLGKSYPADWLVKPAYRDRKDPLWRYPPEEAPWRRLVREAAQRYGADAALIEVDNETDNDDFWRGTQEEYVATWRQAAEELRRALPGTPLGQCGLTAIKPLQTGYYLRELGPQADWITYHSHGDVTNLAQMSGLMQAACAAAGVARPVLFNTEMGYANWRLDQERGAAATGLQKVLYCWAHGQRGALLYCSRDIGGPRQRPGDSDWGFLDYTFCPRFLYPGLAGLVDRLAGCRREAILKEDRLLHAYTFRQSDRLVAALFTPDGAERDATLASDAQTAELVDAMGNTSPIAAPQAAAVKAGFLPVYVVLTGATRVAL